MKKYADMVLRRHREENTMHSVYLDNAATSFPKPPTVAVRMREYVDQIGASVNRGSYASAQQAELVTLRLRQRL